MHNSPYMWNPAASRNENVYVMFQSQVKLDQAGAVTFNMFGSNNYRGYMDGTEFIQGPARFEADHPEYDVSELKLEPGVHILTVIVHYYGVSTRMLSPETPAFLQCEALDASGNVISLQWKCKELEAYTHLKRRLNEQLGWMEYCDTRLLPDISIVQDGADWLEPNEVIVELGEYLPKSIRDCYNIPQAGKLMETGNYVNRFGYENDDLPVRFMLRNLKPGLPSEGVWLRFDLELIGLYCPTITLEAPSGTIVEAGYSEWLTDERVAPFITLSASNSCSMDRWITKEGKQTLQTFSQRGFRFLELHIADPNVNMDSIRVEGIQRTYFDTPKGSFESSDPLLNDIWMMGMHTLRACSEDALTDTPTRERGQWLGDAVAVGMETLSVSFGDLTLIRRGLLQAAYCRSPEGLVCGLYPGQNGFLSSFSLLWVSGCMRYYWKTGERELLLECYDTAVKTMDIFNRDMSPRGITKFEGWDFVDWGHSVNVGEINVALNLMMLGAMRDLVLWELEIGEHASAEARTLQADKLQAIIYETYMNSAGIMAHSVTVEASNQLESEQEHGYQATVLALWQGLLKGEQKKNAISHIKGHILNCFPNDVTAPRLSHPSANNKRLITPYFSHFALHALLESGEVDFVLDQYRICWGWMKEQGVTTLLEVFDPRWSHCHAWAGSPTWQLSLHVLGIMPDRTGNALAFNWNPKPGNLEFAKGELPLNGGKTNLLIQWVKMDGEASWSYELQCETTIKLSLSDEWNVKSLVVDGNVIPEIASELVVNRSLKMVFAAN